MRALLVSAVVFGLVLSACGSQPSLIEYAGDLETLVAEMNGTLDALDDELPGTPSLEDVNRYARERVAARSAFLEALRSIDPPSDVADLHNAAIDIMERLTGAEAALAERVAGMQTAASLDGIWETPEGIAARAADERAVAICHVAQDEFDQTERRAGLEGVPWIPPEMKETIRVTFGCDAEDR